MQSVFSSRSLETDGTGRPGWGHASWTPAFFAVDSMRKKQSNCGINCGHVKVGVRALN